MTTQGFHNPFRNFDRRKRVRVMIGGAIATTMLIGGVSMSFAREKVPAKTLEVADTGHSPPIANDNGSYPDAAAAPAAGSSGAGAGSEPVVGIINDAPEVAAPGVEFLPDEGPGLYQVVGVDGALDVRSGAGAHNPVIATLPADGTNVQTTGRRAVVAGTEWREIEIDGKKGWILAAHLAPMWVLDESTEVPKIVEPRVSPEPSVPTSEAD